jgi:cytidine deaminase
MSKEVVAFNKLNSQEQDLVTAAAQMAEKAYAPYSKFYVGSAILASNSAGEMKMFFGANVENASLGGSICAERSASVSAVNQGYRKFHQLSLLCRDYPGGPPCGICRQFLREFGGLELEVLVLQDLQGSVKRFTLDELLPESFGPEMLP